MVKTKNSHKNVSSRHPYEKKVLVSIGSNTFFALKYWKFPKKVLDPILTNTFFHTGKKLLFKLLFFLFLSFGPFPSAILSSAYSFTAIFSQIHFHSKLFSTVCSKNVSKIHVTIIKKKLTPFYHFHSFLTNCYKTTFSLKITR